MQKFGVYDDEVMLKKYDSNEKEIVFIPMHHIGTENFYNDVELKIDSLKKMQFHFYIEGVAAKVIDDSILRKFRKLTRNPIAKEGYKKNLDSIFGAKLKLRKKIVDQPSFNELGIDSIYGENVDLSLDLLIENYENDYGAVILENCDFETSVYEKSTCYDKKISAENSENLMLNYRNDNILRRIDQEKKKKIAIIYGKGHLKGIARGLLDRGYVEDK